MHDLTIIYITANVIPEKFAQYVQGQLLKAAQGTLIISVSKKSMAFGNVNIVSDTPRSHFNIYRQALEGAKRAGTKYIAIAEDDILYSPEHFKHRSTEGKFAYNFGFWNIFTWGEPVFTHKGGSRRNLSQLICERDLFVKAMNERFDKYPNDEANKDLWAEPGKYERQLGVTVRETEEFYTHPSNIVFSHETALSYEGLGTRKRLGEFRAYDIPHWGSAKEIRSKYE